TDRLRKNPSTIGAAESSEWQNLNRKWSRRILKVLCCWGHVRNRDVDDPAGASFSYSWKIKFTDHFRTWRSEHMTLMGGAHAIRSVVR
ncbi:hypothetical protein PENTCL1PPCAC_27343, partial [Pristionchus entomophagus]